MTRQRTFLILVGALLIAILGVVWLRARTPAGPLAQPGVGSSYAGWTAPPGSVTTAALLVVGKSGLTYTVTKVEMPDAPSALRVVDARVVQLTDGMVIPIGGVPWSNAEPLATPLPAVIHGQGQILVALTGTQPGTWLAPETSITYVVGGRTYRAVYHIGAKVRISTT